MAEIVLAEERRFYESHKPELLRRYNGRYVLIKGSALLGVYDDPDDAYRAGLKQLGLLPFLVHLVQEREPIHIVLSSMSGSLGDD